MPTNTRNLTLGRGRVYFSRFKPGTRDPDGFRYIGNTPEFALNIESDELDHYDADGGIRVKDDSLTLEVNRSGSLTTDNIDPENVALFFFGDSEVVTQTSAASQTLTIEDAHPGHSYKIGATAENPAGFFGLDPAGFGVALSGGAALVAGTDYEVDLDGGMLHLLPESTALTSPTDVNVTFAVRASTRARVISGTEAVEGAVMFRSNNPRGGQAVITMPWVKVRPSGDYALKGDEWQMIPLTMEILKPHNAEAIYRDGLPVFTS